MPACSVRCVVWLHVAIRLMQDELNAIEVKRVEFRRMARPAVATLLAAVTLAACSHQSHRDPSATGPTASGTSTDIPTGAGKACTALLSEPALVALPAAMTHLTDATSRATALIRVDAAVTVLRSTGQRVPTLSAALSTAAESLAALHSPLTLPLVQSAQAALATVEKQVRSCA
jgi:hypothetical protein